MTGAPRTAPGAPVPTAPGEPDAVGVRWMLLFGLAWFGYWLLILLPLQFMLPNLFTHIAPAHKVGLLSLLLITDAAALVISVPVAGAVCDRTLHRIGRRTWALGGFVFAAVPFSLVGVVTHWQLVAVLMAISSAGCAVVLVSLSALIADSVPVRQRGTASAAMGVTQVIAVIAGMVVVTMLVTSIPASWALIAVLAVVVPLPFLLGTRGSGPPVPQSARVHQAELPPFPRPRRDPAYYWALLSRVLINTGNTVGTAYLLYFLDDVLHRGDPNGSLLILTVVYLVFCALCGYAGGIVSDRLHRRRVLVALAGALQAGAATVLVVTPTWPAAIVAAVLLGAGFGAFLSVDQALVTDVLPNERSRARDIGVINAAQNVPLAAGIGWVVLTAGDSYRLLYAVAAVVMLLGSVSVYRIKAVR